MTASMLDALLPLLGAGGVGVAIGALGARAMARRRAPKTPAAPAPAASTLRIEPHLDAARRRLPSAPALPRAADLLLVDDSAVARAKLRRLFEGAGYHVQLAHDGVEALALLDKGRYALMVTDLEMPNMDGPALIDACRKRAHTLRMPILAITGHESLRMAFNDCRDISGIHRKPWVDDILLSHVGTLAGSRNAAAAAPTA